MSTFKYMAWIDGKYWQGHNLLSRSQIFNVLKLLNWEHPVFTSIQNYDHEGNILSCPIYFDMDGEPSMVLSEAKKLLQFLEYHLGVTPYIYFSGNKGFHFIVPYMIEHHQCHLIVKYLAEQTYLKTVDLKVYGSRRYWRVPNSKASKDGYYKVRISREELLSAEVPQQISKLGKSQRPNPSDMDMSKLNQDFINELIESATDYLPTYSSLDDKQTGCIKSSWTPCLETMFNNQPEEGNWNQTIHILTRFFKICGLSEEEAFKYFMSQPHYKVCEQSRQVSKVLSSVYGNTQTPKLGCKQGSDAVLRRQFCDIFCQFNEDLKFKFKEEQ